jgi:hypothetical protein
MDGFIAVSWKKTPCCGQAPPINQHYKFINSLAGTHNSSC